MYPLHPLEVERLGALHDLGLSTGVEPQYDAICRTARTLFGVPIAYVSIVGETQQWFKGKCGLNLDGTPREHSLCTYTICSSEVLVVEDATLDERFATSPLVTSEPYTRFYAGAPLVVAPGINVGSLCLIDRVPRIFDREQRAQLEDLARIVVAQLRSSRAEREARESGTSFRLLAENTTDMIVESDLDGTRRYISPAAKTLLGYDPAELVGTTPLDFVHPDEVDALAALLKDVAEGNLGRATAQHRYRRKDGSWIWVEICFGLTRDEATAPPKGIVASIRDISSRKEAERQMAHMARHDPLTGLPNRLLFHESLERELVRAERHAAGFALFCLDLDRFKIVNDTLGHQAGDALLRVVARRLKSVLRAEDTVARLGGDEFVIIHMGHPLPETAARLAERLIAAMAPPVDLDGYPAGIGVSIGIALAPGDAADPDTLFACADRALYRAKSEGRNTYRFHDRSSLHVTDMPLRTDAECETQDAVGCAEDGVVFCGEAERYRLAALATRDAIWDWDLASDRLTMNGSASALFGHGEAEMTVTDAWWRSKIHPDDRERVGASIARLVEGREDRWTDEYRFERRDGTYSEVIDRGFVIRNDRGQAVRMVGAMHDVTEQRRAGAALRSSEERLRLALRAGRMVAWEHNVRTGVSRRSENSMQVLGLPSEDSTFFEHVYPDDRAQMASFLQASESREYREFRYSSPAGRMLWLCSSVERLDEERLVGITFDITERKLAEEQAWRAANYDALTGLPNRRLFQQRFEEFLAAAERSGTCVSLLLFDLDGLRDVNDVRGHDAGDAVLCEAARRLGDGLRPGDFLARLGGDEFALLLVDPLRLEHTTNHAQTLVERLRQPFGYRSHSLSCKASTGIAAFPVHHRDSRELLKDADIALYRAKSRGRGGAVLFSADMRTDMEHRLSIAAEVQAAVEADQFVPFYQPKVCFESGRIVGFEALARWQHPEKGLLAPAYFGSAFENPELATAIGDAVLRKVAADMRSWNDKGLGFGRVAVNFASAEFRKPDLAGNVLAVLGAYGIPSSQFEMEVTETVFLGPGSDSVPDTLKRLHESGVLISLDDFGTGFASLTHLKQFPVDHIKIDRSFVRDIEHDDDDDAIVAAVVGLGRSLGMRVTAEGVETLGQAQRLSAMGCDYAQGFLYAKPMAGSRIPWLLGTWDLSAAGRTSLVRLA
ncbi:diguanylate cyclase domain-containing protein [Methylobacterium soli]|uniref:Diguanylate cyclase n=1 Tax=Methylobacterium soli TaxID=553447 RepID=A0A6L3SSP7_9HYPH|nr:diguanylate cyclase [Methylobacterium soli]KAB1076461.1 diguanylate cyclase [Methylobacterium soli]GJE44678.1 hypothetical protein AEGHOMDF_3868 [Methylobacterium soli]